MLGLLPPLVLLNSPPATGTIVNIPALPLGSYEETVLVFLTAVTHCVNEGECEDKLEVEPGKDSFVDLQGIMSSV